MLDNIAFNVVLGLVFIYLLYSLLVTIVGEMLSSWLGMRARILRVAIERMLNDGYYKKIENEKSFIPVWLWKFWLWLVNNIREFFLYEQNAFRNSFAGRFYQNPSIKFLSKLESDQKGLFGQTKPSYLTAERFAATLMNMFIEKGAGKNNLQKIGFSLQFNTHHIQPETAKQIKELFNNSGGDIAAFKEKLMKWFDETMDRASGWYKRRLRFILFWFGFFVAVGFNVDSIRIARLLANDKDARNQLVTMGVALAKDSARYKDFIHSNGDSIHAKSVIDTGFSRITKDINEADLILGLGWGFNNMNKPQKIEIEKSKDGLSFATISKRKNDFYKFRDLTANIKYSLEQRTLSKDSLLQKIESLTVDSIEESISTAEKSKAKSPEKIKQQKDSIFKRIQLINADNSSDSLLLRISKKNLNHINSLVDSITGNTFTAIESISISQKQDCIIISGKRNYSGLEKLLYILANFVLPSRLLGLILTAFALSLGAPFWFGILNKLVSLRSAGVKPEEKTDVPVKKEDPKTTSPVLSTATNAVAASPVIADSIDEAISTYGDILKSIPGVKSIFKVFDNKSKTNQLQINVADKNVEAIVQSKLNQIYSNKPAVNYAIVITGIPKSHQNNTGEISNASGLNGFGSLGCILEDTTTQKRHVLSCWHVMKGNTNLDDEDNFTTILDNLGNNLGERWAGGVSGAFDFAIAELFEDRMNENNSGVFKTLQISKTSCRALSNADINDQIAVMYFDCFSANKKAGKILCDTPSVEIHYDDKVRIIEDLLVLTNDTSGTQLPISQPGNSGSIVFDSKGFAIAMIIAGDDTYTYAMKLVNIFSIHDEMKIVN